MRTCIRRSACALLLAVAVLAAGAGADASMYLKQTVADLIQKSHTVVHAKVFDVRSEWNADHSYVFTYVTLEVKRTLQGQKHAYEEVRVPGGTVGDFHAVMEGAPEFRIGDEVVVFLGSWDDGVSMVEGYFQGVSKVARDAAGNEMLDGGSAHGRSISQLARQIAASGK